jgi:hypothetical protein
MFLNAFGVRLRLPDQTQNREPPFGRSQHNQPRDVLL